MKSTFLKRLVAILLTLSLAGDFTVTAATAPARTGYSPIPDLLATQAVAPPPAYSGHAEDHTPVSGAQAAGGVSRRVFLATTGGGAVLSESAAAKPPGPLWPAVPPWSFRSPLEPIQLPPDIEQQLDSRVANANNNTVMAMEQALAAFNQESAPDIRERELIAFALLGVRIVNGSDDQLVKIQTATRLAQLLTNSNAELLWNQEDVLNRLYRSFWHDNNDRFQQTYHYRPISPADFIWLNDLLPQLIENHILEAHSYWQKLQDTGCHIALSNLRTVVQWSQRPERERDAIVQVAAELAKALPGDRLRTPQAMMSLQSFALLRLENPSLSFLEPGVREFVEKLDLLYTDHRVQLDDVVRLLPYRHSPGMQTLLADPARFQDALIPSGSQDGQTPLSQHVLNLMTIAQQKEGLLMVDRLEKQFGYTLSSQDVMAFSLFKSLKELDQHLNAAKQMFGGLPPMTGPLLMAIHNLDTMPPGPRDMLQRLFHDSAPPETVDILQRWTGTAYAWPGILTSFQTTQDAFWQRVAELKAIGWKPGADRQPGQIWSLFTPPVPLETAQLLYRENGWPLRATDEVRALRSLSPAQWADLRRLPPEARADIYLELPGDFLASVNSNPGLWDFFIALQRRGYFSAKVFAESNPANWQTQVNIFYFLLRGLYNAHVQLTGWGALERLQAVSQDPIANILLLRGMTMAVRIEQTGPLQVQSQNITPNWGPWVDPSFVSAMEALHKRTGYRLTTGDTIVRLTQLAKDEGQMTRAAEIRDRTGQTPTAAMRVLLRDDHLKGLYENPDAQALLKILIRKGYRWNGVDTEFIYHLAQKAHWRRWIAGKKLRRVLPDMQEIKFAYLEEQLNRPELRAAIRQNIAGDFANLFTEFGGLFGFKPNGDLVLVPFRSRLEPSQDLEMNGNFDFQPLDRLNIQWYSGRFFAFYHNHAVAGLDLLARASRPDRATAQSFRTIIGLNIVIAATPEPDGRLTVGAYTADSLQRQTGEFRWTEPKDVLYYLHRLYRRLRRPLPPSLRQPPTGGPIPPAGIVGPAYTNPDRSASDVHFEQSIEAYAEVFIKDLEHERDIVRDSLGEAPAPEVPGLLKELARWDKKIPEAKRWLADLTGSEDPWAFLQARYPPTKAEARYLGTVHALYGLETPILFVEPGSWPALVFGMPARGGLTIVTHHNGRPLRFALVSRGIKDPAAAHKTVLHEALHVRFIPEAGFGGTFDFRLHEALTTWRTREMMADTYVHGAGPEARRLRRWLDQAMTAENKRIPESAFSGLQGAALWYARFSHWSNPRSGYWREVALVDWLHDQQPDVDVTHVYETSDFESLYRASPVLAHLRDVAEPILYNPSLLLNKEVWRLFDRVLARPALQTNEAFWQAAATVAGWTNQITGSLLLEEIFASHIKKFMALRPIAVGLEHALQQKIYEDRLFERLVDALAAGRVPKDVLRQANRRIVSLILQILKADHQRRLNLLLETTA